MTALLVAAGIASFITAYTAKDVALARMGTACRRAMPNAEGEAYAAATAAYWEGLHDHRLEERARSTAALSDATVALACAESLLGLVGDPADANVIAEPSEVVQAVSGEKPTTGFPSVTEVEVERAPVVVETESAATYTFSGETLMFCPDSAKFVDEAEAASVLSEVASVAETREGRVRVQASTASYPWNPEYAQALSQERASAAADALVSLGVEAGRIDVEGLGFGGPNYIEDIDPETGLQIPSAATRNRRVTITIE